VAVLVGLEMLIFTTGFMEHAAPALMHIPPDVSLHPARRSA
jgi:hypothetical protein